MPGQTESPAAQRSSCLKSQTMGKNKENQKQGVLFNTNPAGRPDLKGCEPQEQPPAAADDMREGAKGVVCRCFGLEQKALKMSMAKGESVAEGLWEKAARAAGRNPCPSPWGDSSCMPHPLLHEPGGMQPFPGGNTEHLFFGLSGLSRSRQSQAGQNYEGKLK